MPGVIFTYFTCTDLCNNPLPAMVTCRDVHSLQVADADDLVSHINDKDTFVRIKL